MNKIALIITGIAIIALVVLFSGCAGKDTFAENTTGAQTDILSSTSTPEQMISTPTLPQEKLNKQTIAQLSLEWAIIYNNIPDYNLIKDRDHIIVSTKNIDKSYNFSVGNITFSILTPEEIQQKSNIEGDFLYLEFQTLDIRGSRAIVQLNNIWAVSENTKKKGIAYLSGGGATIPFKKERDRWLREDVTETWIS